MPPPTVTAVIPTYRRPRTLRRAVDSVLAQTYPHLRVLVCDNASGDETEAVVAELRRRDSRVAYHRHPENIGARDNFQFGIDTVDTEYFSLLSDDDFMLPHFYERAVAALTRHEEARFFCAQVVFYDEAHETHNVRPYRPWREGLHEAGTWTPLMFERFFAWTSCVFASETRQTLGPLDSIPMADILYLGKAAACFSFVVGLVPCAVFVVSGQNKFANLTTGELRQCREVMMRRCAELPNLTDEQRGEIRRFIEQTIRVAGTDIIRAAMEAGDTERLSEISAYFRERGDLDLRRKLRVAMASRGGPLVTIVRQLTLLNNRYKRMRRSGWKKMSLEEVVKSYSDKEMPAVSSSGAGTAS